MRVLGLTCLLTAAAPASWAMQSSRLVPTLASLNDPAAHVVPAGDNSLAAVAKLSFGDGGACSGALLSTGMHVLTSAHCVAGGVTQISMTFNDVARTQASVTGQDRIRLNPLWTGELSDGNDLAVLVLDQPVTSITGLELSDRSDLIGRTVDLYGYGDYGTGAQGAIYPSDGQLRRARNRYEVDGRDATMQTLGYHFGNLIFYDFDNGQSRFDSFGRFIGLSDTGLSEDQEGSIGLGDSGGPTLLDGRIVGIHSFALQLDGYVRNPSRVGSWGEIGADAMVLPAQEWIHSVAHAPEPGTWAMMGLGLGMAAVVAGRRRR